MEIEKAIKLIEFVNKTSRKYDILPSEVIDIILNKEV